MATNFGALTDHFGLATASLVLVDSNSTPVAYTPERAQNEDGDNVDIQVHGQNAAGDLEDATCVYELQSSTLNLNTLKIGEISANLIAATLEAVTSNGAWPRITVTGQLNTETVVAPTGYANTWTIPDSIILIGAKRAQPMDFTYSDTECKLTDSTYTAAVEIASTADGEGVVTAHGVSGGALTQGATFVRLTAAPSWTPGASWEETQAPGEEEPQAGFHTGSGSAEKNMTRDSSGS